MPQAEEFSFGVVLRRALEGVCSVDDGQCEALERHFEMLVRWNRRLNLTSVRRPEEMVLRHYCESVFLAQHLPEGEIRVVDVGSGAGFPGIGVAVMRPQARVCLVEGNQKKATFLKEATRELQRVEVRACRAEALTEQFDWQVGRGVAWEELPLVADRLALLGSEPAPRFEWRSVIRLPWGDRRLLLIGDVPRGTSTKGHTV